MNRRQILQGIGAAAASPMLPGSVLVGINPANSPLMVKAAEWAGMWDHSTVSMLKYRFNLNDASAANLFNNLVSQGIIGEPDARGISKVIVSTYKNPFAAAKLESILRGDPILPQTKTNKTEPDTADGPTDKTTAKAKKPDVPQKDHIAKNSASELEPQETIADQPVHETDQSPKQAPEEEQTDE